MTLSRCSNGGSERHHWGRARKAGRRSGEEPGGAPRRHAEVGDTRDGKLEAPGREGGSSQRPLGKPVEEPVSVRKGTRVGRG